MSWRDRTHTYRADLVDVEHRHLLLEQPTEVIVVLLTLLGDPVAILHDDKRRVSTIAADGVRALVVAWYQIVEEARVGDVDAKLEGIPLCRDGLVVSNKQAISRIDRSLDTVPHWHTAARWLRLQQQ